jgi:ABC-2 type transport system ATP-binding protein
MVTPTTGAISISGKNPDNSESRKDIAFISEQPYFYPHLTVCESLLFAARLHGLSRADLRKDIDITLERVGLEGLSKRKIKDLSKGMQQRCAMAQALLMHSNILILDEPLSGLDPLGRRLFRDILRELAQNGSTVFFSTHIIDDIESLCRNVVVLSKGRVEYQGAIERLLEKGNQGAEIVVAALPMGLKENLIRIGCRVSTLVSGKTLIFAPADIDDKQCQRALFEQSVYCESITKRCTPLEEILYNRGQKRGS